MFKKIFFPLSLALVFAGCGDSSSSGDSSDNTIPEVDSFDDLVHCTKKHYGELVKVLELDSIYECTSDDWVAADSSTIEAHLSKSSTSKEKAESSSSVKASSEDVKKIEKKKVESVKLSGYAQKGPFADGTTVNVYGLDDKLEETKTKFSGKTSGDSGLFSIKDITLDNQYALIEVSGFFENFVTGKTTSGTRTKLHAIVDLSSVKSVKANVNLFTELEYARVKQLVVNDKFNVPAAKKYATKEILSLFGVEGSKDLVATSLSLADTGSVGASLYAFAVMMIADLSTSKFGSRLDDFVEDFAKDGSWDDVGMRASVAVFLSSYVDADSVRARAKAAKISKNVPNFEKILLNFWTDELGLGKCTDSLETTIKKVTNKDSDLYGSGFACTSKRWHKSSELDTELGLCVAKREGEFKESKLKKSPTYFTCKFGEWKEISKTAYELKSCTSKREKEYVKAESGEMFVCLNKQWKELDKVTYELKLCTESRNEKIEKAKSGKYYACIKDEWLEVDEIDSKIGYPCTENHWNSKEKINGKYYRCDGKKWTEISADIYSLSKCAEDYVGGCEEAPSGKYYHCVKTEDDYLWEDYDGVSCNYGDCRASINDSLAVYKKQGYFCDGEKWNTCDALYAGKLLGGMACVDSMSIDGQIYAWRKAEKTDAELGYTCNDDTKITADDFDDSKWIYYDGGDKAVYCVNHCDEVYCQAGVKIFEWIDVSEEEAKTGLRCVVKTAYVLKNGYACDGYGSHNYDYNWRKASANEIKVNKICNEMVNLNEVLDGYFCEINNGKADWRKAEEGEIATGKICGDVNLYEVNKGYICDHVSGEGWHWRVADEGEKITEKACSDANLHEVKKGYVCDYTSDKELHWRVADDGEIATGKVCTEDNLYEVEFGKAPYSCKDKDGTSSPKWYYANEIERIVGKVCNRNIEDQFMHGKDAENKDLVYWCSFKTHQWMKVEDSTFGVHCSERHVLETRKHESKDYVCDSIVISRDSTFFEWRLQNIVEKESGKICSEDNLNTLYKVKGMDFKCEKIESGRYVYTVTIIDNRDNESYKAWAVGPKVILDEARYITPYSECRHPHDAHCKGGRLYWPPLDDVCPKGWETFPSNDFGSAFYLFALDLENVSSYYDGKKYQVMDRDYIYEFLVNVVYNEKKNDYKTYQYDSSKKMYFGHAVMPDNYGGTGYSFPVRCVLFE